MKDNKTQISVGFFKRFMNYLTAKRYKQKLESQKYSVNLNWVRLGKISFLACFWCVGNYFVYSSKLNLNEMKQESDLIIKELKGYMKRNVDTVFYEEQKVIEEDKKIFANSFKFEKRELHGVIEKVIDRLIKQCNLNISKDYFSLVKITNLFSFDDFSEADIKTKGILRYKNK